jgi:nucleoside permease NupC
MSERPQRQRVVLAHRRGARMVRTRVEVQEQTPVGDALVRGLVRAQLGLALRLGAVLVLLVGAIPLLNALFPGLGAVTVFGIRLNWLVLAGLVYPLLYGVGWAYVHLAEQGERDFVGVVDAEP